MAAHSWGENVFRNFLGWVERLDDGWTEKHVGAYVNIAGCVLGVPKVSRRGGLVRRTNLDPWPWPRP